MAFTTTASNTLLKQMTGKESSSGILYNCYMGLSTTTPNADGTGFTEPAASTGYARARIGLSGTPATQVMGNPSNGSITNTSIIYFPIALANYGDAVTYFGLFTAETGGTLMIYGALTSPVTVLKDYVPLFNTSNFTMTLS